MEIDFTQVKEYLEIINISNEPKDNTLIDITKLVREPFKHQITGAKTLLEWGGGLLCDEQGLGKSLTGIIILESKPGKKLIICPQSLKLNWEKEIRYISEKPIFIAISNKPWQSCSGWTIINYDILERFFEKIKNENFNSVLLDESHYIKSLENNGSPGSGRAKCALEICDNIPFVIPCTGTPISNRTKDIFNLLRLIKHPLSLDFYKFADRFCDPKNFGYGTDYTGSSNKEELNTILNKCMVRRLKKDALDLPPKLRTFIPLEIDIVEYEKKLEEYFSHRKKYKSKFNHLVELNALKMLLAKEKVKSTIEIADNILLQNKPVIIFTCYDDVLKELTEYYKENCVVISGRTSSKKRQLAVDMFQSGNKTVFIGNIQAAGVGLTLTKSDSIIFNDYSYIPAWHQQAEDRIHRISQNKVTNIYYMYAKNVEIEEMITKMLDEKLRIISSTVDGDELDFTDDIIKLLQNRQDKQEKMKLIS